MFYFFVKEVGKEGSDRTVGKGFDLKNGKRDSVIFLDFFCLFLFAFDLACVWFPSQGLLSSFYILMAEWRFEQWVWLHFGKTLRALGGSDLILFKTHFSVLW